MKPRIPQGTIAYSLDRLRRMANDWESAKALAGAAWLPSAKEEPDVELALSVRRDPFLM